MRQYSIKTIAWLAMAVGLWAAVEVTWAQQELFVIAPSGENVESKRDEINKRCDTKRHHFMTINRNAFDRKGLLLNLFDDTKFKIRIDKIDKPENISGEAKEIWYGEVDGAKVSDVMIFIYDDYITGRINSDNRLFMIERADNGLAAIVEIDKSKMVTESNSVKVK